MRTFIVVLLGLACAKPYRPAGEPAPRNVSGVYSVRESLYSSTCPGMSARKDAFRIEVQHPAGALTLKFTLEGQPFDAQIRPDGNFTTTAQTIQRGASTTTTAIAGRFTETGFSARVTMRRTAPVVAARPGDPTSMACDYQLRWQAEKL